jgi:hypothetical protein
MKNLGMKDAEYTSIPEWMNIVASFWICDHHIAVGSRVRGILTTAHIICGVVNAEHLGGIYSVPNDAHGVSLIVRKLCLVTIIFGVQPTP